MTQNGSGQLTLSGSLNTYNGGTVINGGTLAVTNAASLGNLNAGVVINNGTLEVATGFASTRQVTFNAPNATLQVDAGQTYTSNTAFLAPGGTITKTGSGTLALGIASAQRPSGGQQRHD